MPLEAPPIDQIGQRGHASCNPLSASLPLRVGEIAEPGKSLVQGDQFCANGMFPGSQLFRVAASRAVQPRASLATQPRRIAGRFQIAKVHCQGQRFSIGGQYRAVARHNTAPIARQRHGSFDRFAGQPPKVFAVGYFQLQRSAKHHC